MPSDEAFRRGSLIKLLFGCSAGLLLMMHLSVSASAQSSMAHFDSNSQSPAEEPYFPEAIFSAAERQHPNVIANWFGGYLRKMAEPSLFQEVSPKGAASFRLTRISPLGTEVVVRLNILGPGVAKVTTKVALGDGSMLSENRRDVSSPEIEEFLKLLKDGHFWSTPSAEPPEGMEPMDGQIWLIEGRSTQGYHALFRSNPKPSHYTEIGRFLAKTLGRLDDSIISVPAYTRNSTLLPDSDSKN